MVPGRAQLLAQLVRHLRRAETRVVGVVADEQNPERLSRHAPTAGPASSASSVRSIAKRSLVDAAAGGSQRRPAGGIAQQRDDGRANRAGVRRGRERNGPVSRHTASVSAPAVVTVATPFASAAITDVRRVVTPSGYGCTTTSQARSAAAMSACEMAPVPSMRLASDGFCRQSLCHERSLPCPMQTNRAFECE